VKNLRTSVSSVPPQTAQFVINRRFPFLRRKRYPDRAIVGGIGILRQTRFVPGDTGKVPGEHMTMILCRNPFYRIACGIVLLPNKD
jgi:hypothetical protein